MTRFTVNLIPHTADHTTLGGITTGRQLNLEIDVLARYLKRMTEARG
jgi:riboflavin synthase